MNESTRLLYKCIEGRYVKVTWSHKIQEIQGDIYLENGQCVKNATCWLSVLTTGGALTSILSFIEPQISGIITAVFAVLLSYFTVRYKDGQLEEKAKANKIFAAKLHDLRNRYESLMTDILAGLLNDNEIVNKRNELRGEENLLYIEAPHTSSNAVKKAEKALKTNKESTTEEDEIDAIVPKDLIVH